jgi:hypothetical protein
MGCENLIQFFFNMNLNIRLYHWQTTKYPRHVASGELYEKLNELTDKFIETFMGRYKRPEYKDTFKISVKQYTDNTIIDLLKEYANYLRTNVEPILKEGDTDLLNIRDEMLGEINQTLYLFTLN